MPTPNPLILCAGCKIQLGYVLDGFNVGDICDACLGEGLEPYQQEPYHPEIRNQTNIESLAREVLRLAASIESVKRRVEEVERNNG